MWSGTYEEIRVDRMSMKYSWLCSRLNLYCDYYDAELWACYENNVSLFGPCSKLVCIGGSTEYGSL